MPDEPSFVVCKFGGTSVSSLAQWETIAKILRDRISEGLRPLVVCSALSQVSNRLEAAVDRALAGEDPSDFIAALRAQHLDFAKELGVTVETGVDGLIDELARCLTGMSLLREASPGIQAEALAVGEMLSTHIGATWLDAQGLSTGWLDARTLLCAQERPQDPHRQ